MIVSNLASQLSYLKTTLPKIRLLPISVVCCVFAVSGCGKGERSPGGDAAQLHRPKQVVEVDTGITTFAAMALTDPFALADSLTLKRGEFETSAQLRERLKLLSNGKAYLVSMMASDRKPEVLSAEDAFISEAERSHVAYLAQATGGPKGTQVDYKRSKRLMAVFDATIAFVKSSRDDKYHESSCLARTKYNPDRALLTPILPVHILPFFNSDASEPAVSVACRDLNSVARNSPVLTSQVSVTRPDIDIKHLYNPDSFPVSPVDAQRIKPRLQMLLLFIPAPSPDGAIVVGERISAAPITSNAPRIEGEERTIWSSAIWLLMADTTTHRIVYRSKL